jgi:hypothetical protein
MATFRTILSVVGTLPIIVAAWLWFQRWQRGRHLLGFRRRAPIDLVLTTSTVAAAIHGVPVHRPLTGYGQVRAVASCAKALASHYPRKDVHIHLSGFIRNRLDRDLVILGGPAKNEAARDLLDDLPRRYTFNAFAFDDEADTLQFDDGRGSQFTQLHFAPQIMDGYPVSDYGLIVAMKRGANSSHRTILCAGFTTYGTAAAAEYLFNDLVALSRWQLRKKLQLRILAPGDDFLVVVKARFSRGECIEVVPIVQTRLQKRT